MNINGQQYKVVGSKEFMHKGENRTEITLQKPRGKKLLYVVRYADGSLSSVV